MYTHISTIHGQSIICNELIYVCQSQSSIIILAHGRLPLFTAVQDAIALLAPCGEI